MTTKKNDGSVRKSPPVPVTSKKQVIISMNNVYVQSVFKIFKRYLIEEATGQGITADLRLLQRLKDSRNLHSVERNAIVNGFYFGVQDETNTELLFTF